MTEFHTNVNQYYSILTIVSLKYYVDMSLIFVDWKPGDQEEDNCAVDCISNDICGLSEEDIRKICIERIIGCLS